VSSLWNKDQPQPQPDPVPEPTADSPAQEKWAWVMAIQNGTERQVLGWRTLADFRPTQISQSDGPNIFQDDPKRPPPTTPATGSQPDPGGKPNRDTEPKSESQELFE
jgi:hypothetical protein